MVDEKIRFSDAELTEFKELIQSKLDIIYYYIC